MREAGYESVDAPRGIRAPERDTTGFPISPIPAANVAQIPQRSPLRYPGGKTWLVPHVRAWLKATGAPHPLIVEPFAGGAVVSLTAVMEGLADRAIMVELDPDVAAFWRAALKHGDALMARVRDFTPGREEVERLASQRPADTLERGFRTLVLNRTRRGGVLAAGAALIKRGENGNGVASRWYPDTLVKRLRAIQQHADRLASFEGDGVRLLRDMAIYRADACFFIDPPYTARGGKRAGARLYAHHTVDHAALFATLAESAANFLMTYDYSQEIVGLVGKHGFHAAAVTMKNGHHDRLRELVITRYRLLA